MTLRLGSSARTRKMDVPPMPSSGFTMASPCASMKACSASVSRVTSVGVVNSANFAMASFSLWSRIARGWLNTRAPSRCAASSRYVE